MDDSRRVHENICQQKVVGKIRKKKLMVNGIVSYCVWQTSDWYQYHILWRRKFFFGLWKPHSRNAPNGGYGDSCIKSFFAANELKSIHRKLDLRTLYNFQNFLVLGVRRCCLCQCCQMPDYSRRFSNMEHDFIHWNDGAVLGYQWSSKHSISWKSVNSA